MSPAADSSALRDCDDESECELFGACDGLELHWRSRADPAIAGRISLLPVARMFARDEVWGDEAFRGDPWHDDYADDLGADALAAFKSLRPLRGFETDRVAPYAGRLSIESGSRSSATAPSERGFLNVIRTSPSGPRVTRSCGTAGCARQVGALQQRLPDGLVVPAGPSRREG